MKEARKQIFTDSGDVYFVDPEKVAKRQIRTLLALAYAAKRAEEVEQSTAPLSPDAVSFTS